MDRNEYNTKKAELLGQRKTIDDALDSLSCYYREQELADMREKYNGKYALIYSKVPTLMGIGDIIPNDYTTHHIKIPNDYTIHHIKMVSFVGNGFILYTGTQYTVKMTPSGAALEILSSDAAHGMSIQMSTIHEPDELIDSTDFVQKMIALQNHVTELVHDMCQKV